MHSGPADRWRRCSLEDLEGRWPKDAPANALTAKVLRARRIALDRLHRSQLRVLVAQRVGVRFVVPLAFELLARSPLIECEFYPGDLLEALARLPEHDRALPPDFGPRLREALTCALAARVPMLLPALRAELEARARELAG